VKVNETILMRKAVGHCGRGLATILDDATPVRGIFGYSILLWISAKNSPNLSSPMGFEPVLVTTASPEIFRRIGS